MENSENGLSIIIVSFQRLKALKELLKSILKQDLDGLVFEIILINNSPNYAFSTSLFSTVGRLLRKFKNISIINSESNLGCSVRYEYVSIAKFNMIMLLDDDIIIKDPDFVKSIYLAYLARSINNSIFSSWCAILKPENIDYFDTIPVTFQDKTINHMEKIIEVDLIGPGISIFDRQLIDEKTLEIPQEYRDVDNVWFSLIPSLTNGTKKYYFPSYGKLQFHKECKKGAMYAKSGVINKKNKLLNELVAKGYIPIKTKKQLIDLIK